VMPLLGTQDAPLHPRADAAGAVPPTPTCSRPGQAGDDRVSSAFVTSTGPGGYQPLLGAGSPVGAAPASGANRFGPRSGSKRDPFGDSEEEGEGEEEGGLLGGDNLRSPGVGSPRSPSKKAHRLRRRCVHVCMCACVHVFVACPLCGCCVPVRVGGRMCACAAALSSEEHTCLLGSATTGTLRLAVHALAKNVTRVPSLCDPCLGSFPRDPSRRTSVGKGAKSKSPGRSPRSLAVRPVPEVCGSPH
jgi:hypothetical protein